MKLESMQEMFVSMHTLEALCLVFCICLTLALVLIHVPKSIDKTPYLSLSAFAKQLEHQGPHTRLQLEHNSCIFLQITRDCHSQWSATLFFAYSDQVEASDQQEAHREMIT